jgi:hypothetical protein
LDQPDPLQPDGPGKHPDPAERRLHVRHRCRESRFVSILLKLGHPQTRALLNDVSLGGIGLIFSRRLEVGSVVLVRVEESKGMAGLRQARVRHTTRREDGTWLIGCQFTHLLGEDDLRQLLPEAERLGGPPGPKVPLTEAPGPPRPGFREKAAALRPLITFVT